MYRTVILAVATAFGLVGTQRGPNAVAQTEPPPTSRPAEVAPPSTPPPSTPPPPAPAPALDAAEVHLVDPPVTVSFRLVDNIRLRGAVRAWRLESFDGDFGERRWADVHPRDRWKVLSRLAGSRDADDWIDVGAVLLLAALDHPDTDPQDAARDAERAFTRAERLDAATATDAERVRTAIDAEGERRRIEAAQRESDRLGRLSPEAQTWGSTPWPALTPTEQAAAVNTMRSDAERILRRAGVTLAPIETQYFIVYADVPRAEAARWVRDLDTMYARLAERFGIPADHNIFWGKAVIFVWKSRDRYRLVEADSFNQMVPKWSEGICHPIGPKVFVDFYRQKDTARFATILVHEAVHGFMHRYRTPMRLPEWANEGFSDAVAASLVRNSPIDLERRGFGIRQIRRGINVQAVLDMNYKDGTWPGPGNVGYAIGYLLVDLMLLDRPEGFRRWVDAIKAGKHWEVALREDYGVDRRTLVDTFVQYYKVND